MKLGADYTVNLESENSENMVMELTDGYGADVVLECAGAPSAVDMGLNLIRKQGKYTQIGLFGRPIQVDFEKVAYKEVKLTGSLSQRWTAWRRGLSLLSQGKVRVKPLISDVLPVTEWRRGFEKFESKKGLKIMLEPENY